MIKNIFLNIYYIIIKIKNKFKKKKKDDWDRFVY